MDTFAFAGVYQATFEIDFWSHCMNAWEASAQGFDPSGNVMARVAQGGAVSTLLDMAAAFLAFWTGPITAGYVMGFFVGLGSTLFEDLSMFLHLQELWEALQQIPALLGQILADPSLLLEMVKGLVAGILAKADAINPYGAGSLDAGALFENLTALYWSFLNPLASPPDLPANDAFNLAFFLGYAAGFVAEQFLVNALMGGVLAAFKVGDKVMDAVRALKKGLETAKDALVKSAKAVGRAAKLVAQKVGRGLAKHTADIFENLGLRWSDDMVLGASGVVARQGAGPASKALTKLDDMIKSFGAKLKNSFKNFNDDHGWKKHALREKQFLDDAGEPLSWKAYQQLAGEVVEHGDSRFVYYNIQGKPRYGFYRSADNVFVVADESGNLVTMFKPKLGMSYIDGLGGVPIP